MIVCNDFSQECVEIALEFLVAGESKDLSKALATEIYQLEVITKIIYGKTHGEHY